MQWSRAACVFVGVASLGCGSTTPADSMDGGDPCAVPLEACGGALEGRWKWSPECFVPDAFPGCASATVDTSRADWTFDFRSSGIFEETDQGKGDLLFPGTCIGAAGLAASCDALRQKVDFAQCTAAGDGGCRCVPRAAGAALGSWSVSGGRVTLVNAMGSIAYPYCVRGDVLQIQLEPSQVWIGHRR